MARSTTIRPDSSRKSRLASAEREAKRQDFGQEITGIARQTPRADRLTAGV